jgi:hypothetical protein
MCNRTILGDPEIKTASKVVYLIIKEFGENGIITKKEIEKHFSDGRYVLNTALKDLYLKKYLHSAQMRDNLGKIECFLYVATDESIEMTTDDIINYIEKNSAKYGHFKQSNNESFSQLSTVPKISTVDASIYKESRAYDNIYYIYILLNNILTYIIRNNKYKYNYMKIVDFLESLSDSMSSDKTNNISYEKDIAPTKINKKSYYKEDKEKEYSFIKEKQLLAYWNKLDNTPTHRENTDTEKYILRRLRKELRYNSPTIIQNAMDNYDFVLNMPNSIIKNKKAPFRIGLNEFFGFNPYHRTSIKDNNHPLQNIKNWFEECKKGKKYLTKTYSSMLKDNNPECTHEIKYHIVKYDLFDITDSSDISPKDQNMIIKAAEKMSNFIALHRYNLRDAEEITADKLCEYISRAKDNHIGWLLSDITWKNIEKEMIKQGTIQEMDPNLEIRNGIEYYNGMRVYTMEEIEAEKEKNKLDIEPDDDYDPDFYSLDPMEIIMGRKLNNPNGMRA